MDLVTVVLAAVSVMGIVAAVWLAHNHSRVYAAAATRWRTVSRPLSCHLAYHRVGGAAPTVLGVGLFTVCGLSAILAYVTDSVREYDGITVLDHPIVVWCAAHREPALTTAMRTLSTAGSPGAMVLTAATVCGAAAWHIRRWLPMAMAGIGMVGFAVTASVVKLVVARPRPPLPYAMTALADYSFPSGHALGATTGLLLSAWVLGHWLIRSFIGRIAVWTTAFVMIGGVGISRVYLGVHYPSDVLAGWLLGSIWSAALVTSAALYDSVQGQRSPPTPCPRSGRSSASVWPSPRLQPPHEQSSRTDDGTPVGL